MRIIFSMMALMGYLFISTFFILSLIGMNHDINHNMNHVGMSNCSYIVGQDVFCNMNIIEFITKWENMFSIIIPSYNTLFFLIFIPVSFSLLIVSLLPFKLFIYLKRRLNILILYEWLFSDGILNSKAY
jgi:hypothetical protein